MKSLKVKNILDKGAEESMNNDIKRNKDIREIEEALVKKSFWGDEADIGNTTSPTIS